MGSVNRGENADGMRHSCGKDHHGGELKLWMNVGDDQRLRIGEGSLEVPRLVLTGVL